MLNIYSVTFVTFVIIKSNDLYIFTLANTSNQKKREASASLFSRPIYQSYFFAKGNSVKKFSVVARSTSSTETPFSNAIY